MNISIRPSRLLMYAILIAMSLFYLIPFYVIFMTSFKTAAEATLDNIWVLPKGMDLSGYKAAFARLAPNFLNSVLLVVPATVISSLLGSFNGYLLAKWKFRGSDTLFTLVLFGMFIPYQSILIPLVFTLMKLGLYNSIAGLVFVHVVYGIPICTLIFRNFYVNIPNEMLEAGKTDGCGLFGIYRYLILPLSIPSFVVVGIWQFTSIWNEFLFAVTVTGSGSQPIMVALQSLAGSQVTNWSLQMSGSVLAALPTMLVYIFLSRYFIRGLLSGSIKG
jgi:glucose/mannose transport system permease protein